METQAMIAKGLTIGSLISKIEQAGIKTGRIALLVEKAQSMRIQAGELFTLGKDEKAHFYRNEAILYETQAVLARKEYNDEIEEMRTLAWNELERRAKATETINAESSFEFTPLTGAAQLESYPDGFFLFRPKQGRGRDRFIKRSPKWGNGLREVSVESLLERYDAFAPIVNAPDSNDAVVCLEELRSELTTIFGRVIMTPEKGYTDERYMLITDARQIVEELLKLRESVNDSPVDSR